jgi:hypothetical protein
MRFLSSRLLGVDDAVSVQIQNGTKMKNSKSWEKAYEKLDSRLRCDYPLEP